MQTYTTTVYVDEKRRVLIDLPADVPVGEVKVTIEAVATTQSSTRFVSRRDQIMARLATEGLATLGVKYAPDDAIHLSDEERDAIGRKMTSDGKTSLDLVNEEREERL